MLLVQDYYNEKRYTFFSCQISSVEIVFWSTKKNVYKVSMYNLGEYHVLCRWAWSLQERGDLLLREQTAVLDTFTLLAFLFECGWGIYNKSALSSFELFLPKSSLTSKFLWNISGRSNIPTIIWIRSPSVFQ